LLHQAQQSCGSVKERGEKSHYFDISDRPAATDASDGSNKLCVISLHQKLIFSPSKVIYLQQQNSGSWT